VYSSVSTGFVARLERPGICNPVGTGREYQHLNLHRFAAFCSLTDTTKGGYKVVPIDQTPHLARLRNSSNFLRKLVAKRIRFANSSGCNHSDRECSRQARESKLPAAKILDGPRRGIKNMKFFFMEKFVAPPSCLESASGFPLRWRSR
jgi:hypothetical protein